jgi:hypothetical protein
LKRFWRRKNQNDQEVKDKTVDNWKPGMRRRPLQLSYSLEEFEYELEPDKQKQQPRWTLLDKRCGALAIKVGMMPVWDEWGVRHPCTVLYLDNKWDAKLKKRGYNAVQVAGQRKRKTLAIRLYSNMLESDEENPLPSPRFRVTVRNI